MKRYNPRLQPNDANLRWNWQDREFANACNAIKLNRLRLTKEQEALIMEIAKKFI